MIKTRNDMQLVDERLLADEWQTTATPEPEIIAHLFGLYGKATEKTKRAEVTGWAEGAKRSLPSLESLRKWQGKQPMDQRGKR